MVITNQEFVRQGWQCPICKRVYAPQTHMCFSCPEKTETKKFGDGETEKTPDKPTILYCVPYAGQNNPIIDNSAYIPNTTSVYTSRYVTNRF